jgi:hypothetical protein
VGSAIASPENVIVVSPRDGASLTNTNQCAKGARRAEEGRPQLRT